MHNLDSSAKIQLIIVFALWLTSFLSILLLDLSEHLFLCCVFVYIQFVAVFSYVLSFIIWKPPELTAFD